MLPTRKQKLKKVKLHSHPACTSFSWAINYPSVLVCVENTSVAKENERDSQAEGRHGNRGGGRRGPAGYLHVLSRRCKCHLSNFALLFKEGLRGEISSGA